MILNISQMYQGEAMMSGAAKSSSTKNKEQFEEAKAVARIEWRGLM